MMTQFVLNAVNYSVSDNPVGILFNSLSRFIDVDLILIVHCQTAWKNGQGIRENSVENCPP